MEDNEQLKKLFKKNKKKRQANLRDVVKNESDDKERRATANNAAVKKAVGGVRKSFAVLVIIR